MITKNEIYKLKKELALNGFECAYYNNKIDVFIERELIMTIDFDERTIRFCAHTKNINKYPRFSYFMGRIYGILWKSEEKKYRLKMPKPFGSAFHQVYVTLVGDRYIISTNENTESYKSVFTQSEIDAMPFDTNFFIKEETNEQPD